MASPCEFLTRTHDKKKARNLLNLVANEVWRIEDKFSRYLPQNIVGKINSSNGHPMTVDEETANLLDFSESLYQLSNGGFDISSGVLRKAWTFDGSDQVPSLKQIDSALILVGWDKINWQRPMLRLAPKMQIDLGGIGKEYAVDRAAAIITEHADAICMINLGGDLAVGGRDADERSWRVGIESPFEDKPGPERVINLQHGALATSGDSRRYVIRNGIRYGHVLDARTGWPVRNAPRSVTVAADTCTQAGMLATLAMLNGKDAESFLDDQSVQYWCFR